MMTFFALKEKSTECLLGNFYLLLRRLFLKIRKELSIKKIRLQLCILKELRMRLLRKLRMRKSVLSFFFSLGLSFSLLNCVSQKLTPCKNDDNNCHETENFVPKNEHSLNGVLKENGLHKKSQLEKNFSKGDSIQNEYLNEHGLPELGTKLAYYVMSGDSLSKISLKIYNDLSKWKDLAELNQISNPDRIYAGDVVYYVLSDKSKDFARSYENSAFDYLLVKKGDSLSEISKRLFGTSHNWRVLWKENPGIKNPDRLLISEKVSFKEYDTDKYLKKSFHNLVKNSSKILPSSKACSNASFHNQNKNSSQYSQITALTKAVLQ